MAVSLPNNASRNSEHTYGIQLFCISLLRFTCLLYLNMFQFGSLPLANAFVFQI